MKMCLACAAEYTVESSSALDTEMYCSMICEEYATQTQ